MKGTGLMLGVVVGVVTATALYESKNDMGKKMKRNTKDLIHKLENIVS